MEPILRKHLNEWWDNLPREEKSNLIDKHFKLLASDQELFLEDIEIIYNQEHPKPKKENLISRIRNYKPYVGLFHTKVPQEKPLWLWEWWESHSAQEKQDILVKHLDIITNDDDLFTQYLTKVYLKEYQLK